MMNILSDHAARIFKESHRLTETLNPYLSVDCAALVSAMDAIVFAIEGLTIQLAENAERTQSVDAHVETGF